MAHFCAPLAIGSLRWLVSHKTDLNLPVATNNQNATVSESPGGIARWVAPQKAALNIQNSNGETPLIVATAAGGRDCLEKMKLLVNSGADVNLSSHGKVLIPLRYPLFNILLCVDKSSPLHTLLSMESNRRDSIPVLHAELRFLLESGAHLDHMNKRMILMQMLCSITPHFQMAKRL